MQKALLRFLCSWLVVVTLSLSTLATAADGTPASLQPNRRPDGHRWRIGYLEGGPYENYQAHLKAFIMSLANLGWLEKPVFPEVENDAETQTIWNWLSGNARSDFLEFARDAYWSGGWDPETRKQNRTAVLGRLNTAGDIDLMLAFGTHAGQDLANDLHRTPTILFSSSDPIRSGIIKSADDSGYDYFIGVVDPSKYRRQIRLFHEVVRFRKLGVAFIDNSTSRTYGAVDDVHEMAGELGFEVIECSYPVQKSYSEEEREHLLRCHQSVAQRCDAFYLTIQTGINERNLPLLLTPFFDRKIPTFAQDRSSSKPVQNGVLMSLAQKDPRPTARFQAAIFARILHGEKPRSLPQLFEEKQEIAINLETAKRIGFDFPLEILAGAREIYEHIGRPPISLTAPGH